MIRNFFLIFGALACASNADTLSLKDGRTVQGTYLGGDARQIRVAIGERVQTFEVSEVAGIQFGAPQVAAVAPPERPVLLRPERPVIFVPAKPAAELPAGAILAVRMIDDIDSERDRVGQEFKASIDEPVMAGDRAVIPRGADVIVKLIDDKEAGKLSGRTELTIDLVSVQVNGRMVDINTSDVTRRSDSNTKRTGALVGGGAALGAAIGAIAGGGKGAAIGAISGAGAGAAVQVMTKGQKVRIPSETRLEFTTQYAVRL